MSELLRRAMDLTRDRRVEMISDLGNLTGRTWYLAQVGNFSAYSYANNNMSYAYDFLTDSFHLVEGIDGLGINGKIKSIFTGTFADCQLAFYKQRYDMTTAYQNIEADPYNGQC
jgi:hypothetical protein